MSMTDSEWEWISALAVNLAAACIATQLGIGLDYAKKRYCVGHEKEISDRWLALARVADRYCLRDGELK